MNRLTLLFCLVLGLLPIDVLAQSSSDVAAAASGLVEELTSSLEAPKKSIAVLYPRMLDGNINKLSHYLEQKLGHAFFQKRDKVDVIERHKFQPIIDEMKGVDSNLYNSKLGQSLGVAGVDAFVVGTVADLGTEIDITLTMYSTKNAERISVAAQSMVKDRTIANLLGQPAPDPTTSRESSSSSDLSTDKRIGDIVIRKKKVNVGGLDVIATLDFYNGSDEVLYIRSKRKSNPQLSDDQGNSFYYRRGLGSTDYFSLLPRSSNDISVSFQRHESWDIGSVFALSLTMEIANAEGDMIGRHNVNIDDIPKSFGVKRKIRSLLDRLSQ